jgi:hypothetical protein
MGMVAINRRQLIEGALSTVGSRVSQRLVAMHRSLRNYKQPRWT